MKPNNAIETRMAKEGYVPSPWCESTYGINRSWLYRQADGGKIEQKVIGSRRFFKNADVAAALAMPVADIPADGVLTTSPLIEGAPSSEDIG